MNYHNQLHPWCLIRLLPECQRIVIARFRHRNDADEHRRVLRRLIPDATFVVIFDVAQPSVLQEDSQEASRYSKVLRTEY